MARPRKPSHLKVVTGTERPSRVNDAEPTPPAGEPAAAIRRIYPHYI